MLNTASNSCNINDNIFSFLTFIWVDNIKSKSCWACIWHWPSNILERFGQLHIMVCSICLVWKTRCRWHQTSARLSSRSRNWDTQGKLSSYSCSDSRPSNIYYHIYYHSHIIVKLTPMRSSTYQKHWSYRVLILNPQIFITIFITIPK